MSQKQGDPYAQQAKKLASSVQRLRGWVGSDPSRTPELADALLDLTAHRLLGHAYADAAADAQEAVVLVGKLLASHGPIGPYTPVDDAARYFTAAVHLATIQVGVGLPDAAGRTMRAALDWKGQLPAEVRVATQIAPRTAVWALSCSARAALEAGEPGRANAYADAAAARLAESGIPGSDDAGYLNADTARLLAGCRWAAGRGDEALEHDQRAKELYDEIVAGRLEEPGRLPPALLNRLAEPLFGLYSEVADRLAAAGDLDRALVTRRALIDLLRGLAKRIGATATTQLAVALTDLADDLRLEGRDEEADESVQEAEVVRAGLAPPAAEPERRERAPGVSRIPAWARLDDEEAFSATTSSADAQVEAARVAEREERAHREAEAKAAAERAEAHRLEAERHAAADREAARREAERREAERVAAEHAAAEHAAAERAAAEQAEAARLEAERRAAEEEAARRESQRRREERIEAHRREEERLAAERVAAEQARLDAAQHDELAEARAAWRQAKDSGERRRTRAAGERLVEVLRPRAEADPQVVPELVAALEDLGSARLRTGDWLGSRAAAKEAKALAKSLRG